MPTDLSRCSAGRRLHPHSPPPALRCVRYLSSDVCPLCAGVIRRIASVIVRPLGFRAIAAFMPRCTDGRGRLCRYRRPPCSTVQRTGSSLFQTATTLVLTCRWFCRHFLWRFRDRTRRQTETNKPMPITKNSYDTPYAAMIKVPFKIPDPRSGSVPIWNGSLLVRRHKAKKNSPEFLDNSLSYRQNS